MNPARIAAAAVLTAALALPTTTVSAAISFRQVYFNGFGTREDIPQGGFTGCNHNGCTGAPLSRLGGQPAGQHDDSRHCTYNPARTTSITGGHLNMHVYTTNGTCWSVNLHTLAPPLTYGQYQIRFRVQTFPVGYHFVALLWPTDGVDGEIDFPEANIGNPWHGFVHATAGGPGFDIYVQQQPFDTLWHTATVTWLPTGITMNLDGRNLPIQGTPPPVPGTPMRLAWHVESDMGGAPKPPASSAGTVQIDSVSESQAVLS